jgi:hypothetical protein
MENGLKLKLPVQDDGIHDVVPTPAITPEQIEAKRVADEAAETERLRLEAEKDKKTPEQIEAERLAAETLAKQNENQIEIYGVNYKLNANGDALKEDGTIHLTKVQIDELATSEAEEDPCELVQTVLDFKPAVNNQPVVYEKTKAGFEQLLLDATTAQAEAIATNVIDNYWDSNPKLKQLRDHIVLGGNPDTFKPQSDWKSIDVSTLTDEQLEQVVLSERLTKGDTEELAKYYIEGLKKDNKLKEFAPASLAFLTATQTTREEAAKLKIKQVEDQQRDNNIKYWNDVNNIITTKKLKIKEEEFVIPESFRIKEDGKVVIKTMSDFNDYIRKERIFVIDGKQVRTTQNIYDIEMEKREVNAHTDLFTALRRFLKNDDSQLVTAKAKHEEVKSIRRIVTRDGAKSTPAIGGALKLNLPVK